MKNFLLFISFQLISSSLFAIERTWTGAVSSEWAVAGNWSPSGVPVATDDAIIPMGSSAVISYGTETVRIVYLYGELTVGASATLAVTGGDLYAFEVQNGTLTNEGTIQVGAPGYTGIGLSLVDNASVSNSGQLAVQAGTSGVEFLSFSNTSFVNTVSGVLSIEAQINLRWFGPTASTLTNHGVINCNSGLWAVNTNLDNSLTSIINDGSIFANTTYGINNEGVIENQACGVIAVNNGNYQNLGETTNAGLIALENALNNTGSFTNNGILHYESLSGGGTFANTGNNAIVVNNSVPIFTYGGSFLGTIEIYKDEALLELAGTFTAPNNFSPDGLSAGVQTLYARISPPGAGVCAFTVPFSYTMTALPVTLINFTALAEGQVTHLSWSTTTETTSNYFEVQHSTDAKNWLEIGRVTAQGESNSRQNYHYAHTSIWPGVNYYRLKMVDFDSDGFNGNFAYSRVVSVVSSEPKGVVGSFYPNPSYGVATVDVSLTKEGIWTITTLDSRGRELRRESRHLQSGVNHVQVNSSSTGLHLVRFSQGNDSFVRKLLVK